MAIVTLIAAGRLEETSLEQAMDSLADAGLPSTPLAWIDPGDACDLDVAGERDAILAALNDWPGDVIVHRGPRTRPRLFVADMDSTMIGQECIDELADFVGAKAAVAAITERAMLGQLDFGAALAERVALLEGLAVPVVGQCLAERVRPNPGAATLIATLKAEGVHTMLVTGGFTAFAGPVAAALGFDEVHANVLSQRDGHLSGGTEGALVDGARKAALLAERRDSLGLATAQAVAIGDGANDSAMVRLAGLGLAYRPKPALAAVADGVIRRHNLTAVLWALGIPRARWLARGDREAGLAASR